MRDAPEIEKSFRDEHAVTERILDVDSTLILWNGQLRNHTQEVFERLRESGHTIYIWSGVGIRRWDMRRHDLDRYVEDYFIKPRSGTTSSWSRWACRLRPTSWSTTTPT